MPERVAQFVPWHFSSLSYSATVESNEASLRKSVVKRCSRFAPARYISWQPATVYLSAAATIHPYLTVNFL
uniref:Uncharacterized protein n=1 Tax=Ascaris lumbricoides TaxID=6252 RepID=A0A0M3HQZ4_ASCLU